MDRAGELGSLRLRADHVREKNLVLRAGPARRRLGRYRRGDQQCLRDETLQTTLEIDVWMGFSGWQNSKSETEGKSNQCI